MATSYIFHIFRWVEEASFSRLDSHNSQCTSPTTLMEARIKSQSSARVVLWKDHKTVSERDLPHCPPHIRSSVVSMPMPLALCDIQSSCQVKWAPPFGSTYSGLQFRKRTPKASSKSACCVVPTGGYPNPSVKSSVAGASLLASTPKGQSLSGDAKMKAQQDLSMGIIKRAKPNTCCFATYLRRVRYRSSRVGPGCVSCECASSLHCADYSSFVERFKQEGITEAMEYFLPNWRQWNQYNLTQICETVRIIAALRMLCEVYHDTTTQIQRSADLSLQYMKAKYKSGLSAGARSSMRWMNIVAVQLPLRRCKKKDDRGRQCSYAGYGFGNHSRKCHFRDTV